jgi:hypothetical protein
MPRVTLVVTMSVIVASCFQLASAQTVPVPSGTSQTAASASSSSGEELAKKLNNPVASLSSVPFQSDFDFGLGTNKDGFRYTATLRPVVPVTLNKDWYMISRTVLPIISQSNVIGTSSQAGLGDTVQSFFFSPNKTTPFIWGAGPALLVPTATDHLLGTQKFGIGPTIVVLKQQSGWTYGMLLNHIWSVAGAHNRSDVNSTFLQPFLGYTTKSLWTFLVNSESSYDWTGRDWSVPIHVTATKLMRFGKLPVSAGGGLRCWATSPPSGPHGCGLRLVVTALFPKG